jgi:hypothetical protein
VALVHCRTLLCKSVLSRSDPYLAFLPPNVREQIETWGADLALNITFDLTKEFIPQHYFDMVRATL